MANYTLGLDNLISLIRAELQNVPYISSFERISYEAKKVQRGDLFIALDYHNIELAIQNGAYGIIFDTDVKISDDEIAWLKVANIQDALLRLLRFHLMQKSIHAYSVDNITLSLFKSISSPKLFLLEGNIEDNLKSIFSFDDGDLIIYNTNSICEELFSIKKRVHDVVTIHPIKITENTIFETSFIYKERLYEHIHLPKFLIPNLQKVFDILDDVNLTFKLKAFVSNHFKPIFINKHFKAVDFGQSSKVIIFEDDIYLFAQAAQFLHHNASWAKSIFFIDEESASSVEGIENLHIYKSQNNLVKKIKKQEFDFALLYKQNSEILKSRYFSEEPQQLSLF